MVSTMTNLNVTVRKTLAPNKFPEQMKWNIDKKAYHLKV